MVVINLTDRVFVDYAISVISIVISAIACVYTVKTYEKSHNILDVISKERIRKWNKKELEHLFSFIPIDCIDSFLNDPTSMRKELWWGLRWVDLSTFQFDGKEKDSIIQFINALDAFRDLNYRETSSKNWKFEPLLEQEPYDEKKEIQEIRKLHSKASSIRPLYDELLKVLMVYHVDLREMRIKAYDNYIDSTKEY